MKYLFIFAISFIISYVITNKYDESLFLSLLLLFFVTFFHYSSVLCLIPILLALCFVYLPRKIKPYYPLLNFFILVYVFISMTEFCIHKYVMHCRSGDWLGKLASFFPFLDKEYTIQCESHLQHHKEVEPDMSLKRVEHEDTLFMAWRVFLFIESMFLLCVFLAKTISNAVIDNRLIFGLSFVITFLYQYLWNKTHVNMHRYAADFSIWMGPYDEKIFDLNWMTALLYQNHENHHMQKGEQKGNYNIIVLGADEWFGTNVKEVDNREYCVSHSSEKICKRSPL